MSKTLSRRKFLKMAAHAGLAAGVTMGLPWKFGVNQAYAYAQTPTGLRKFIQPIQGLGPTGIPVASPKKIFPGIDYYKIVMGQYKQSFHPDLPESTLWGYADVTNGQAPNFRYLGGVIVAQKGRPVKMQAINMLPPVHPLPVDVSVTNALTGYNRAAIHLHGGFVPWNSDGGPFEWFAPDGTHGLSFSNPGPLPGTAEYYYPNDQTARLMWYHDHAFGLTRLNAYAGMATAYIIRDNVENALISKKLIPSREIPLILQEKTFVDGMDPNYVWGKKGDLWYPYLYEKNSNPDGTGRWDYGPDMTPPAVLPNSTLPVPSCVPEFFGDTIVVNGAVYPYAEVEPRHYRFRILNASNARFFNLQLYYAQNGDDGEANLTAPGPAMIQIGTEGGFLPFPVVLNYPPKPIAFDPITGNAVGYTLLMAPAERADVIIDFSKVPVGSKLILYSDAPAPFPGGDPRNDYFTDDPDQTSIGGAATTQSGYGPNTRTLMQFRVIPRVGPADPPSLSIIQTLAIQAAKNLNSLAGALLPAIAKMEKNHAVRTRDLTLNEDFDDYGRLIQRLGTTVQNGVNNQGLPTWGIPLEDTPTETPRAGDTEVWRIFNLTGDSHPIHFHLVNVQVLSRQPFDALNFNGTPVFTGPARNPDPNEFGWKETVRIDPGECTTVIMKFDLPKVPFKVPLSPRTGGYEYVWHCHILEHEEHDMMRPLVVKP